MTRIQVLQVQREVFTAQKTELEDIRSDLYVREEQAISNALLPYFEGFHPDVYIEVTRGSIYFKMDHPDYSYRKELFNLYLRERYSENGKRYDGIDLSYYTTSTNGINEWELKRLRMLGDLAEIVSKNQHDVIDAANNAVNRFKEERQRSYDQMNLVNEGIRELDNRISELKSEAILTQLLSEDGVVFDIPQHIELKRIYCPKLNQIKIIEVKDKTCTVKIEINSGYKTTESRVNVESLVNQIKRYNIL